MDIKTHFKGKNCGKMANSPKKKYGQEFAQSKRILTKNCTRTCAPVKTKKGRCKVVCLHVTFMLTSEFGLWQHQMVNVNSSICICTPLHF